MPFGDGTGPLGLGPRGFGRSRGYGRGFGYCRFQSLGFNVDLPLEKTEFLSKEYLLAELKHIEIEIALLQQTQEKLKSLIKEKTEVIKSA